jgi:hypothetical protein
MGAPADPRLVASNLRQADAFRRGAALLPAPPELLEIPYEGTTLPGYFFRVDDKPGRRPTVILTGGYDGTAEELYFLNGAPARLLDPRALAGVVTAAVAASDRSWSRRLLERLACLSGTIRVPATVWCRRWLPA